MAKYGIYPMEYHTTPIKPVSALAIYKALSGWEVWQMIHNDVSNLSQAYRPIARYKTKKETVEKAQKFAAEKNLPVLTNSRGEY